MVTVRDFDLTRQRIMDVAAEEMRLNGYKATSLSSILAKAKVSKGALYHHFTNKKALGFAVLSEVFMEMFLSRWRKALAHSDMIEGIRDMLDGFESESNVENLTLGCPVNTIVQEVVAVDDDFQEYIAGVFNQQLDMLITALTAGVEQGKLRSDIDIEETALFIIASTQGIAGLMKASRSHDCLLKLHTGLMGYLNLLRMPA